MIALQEQITGLLVMTAVGVAGGLFFDIYRALRLQLKLKKRGTLLGDILYCLFFTAFFLLVLLPVNDGQMRSYVYLGLLLGFLFYFYKLHRLLWRWLVLLVKWLCRVGRLCWRIISFPGRFIGRVIYRPIRKAGRVLQVLWVKCLPIRAEENGVKDELASNEQDFGK